MKCQLAILVFLTLSSTVVFGGASIGGNTNQTTASNVILPSGGAAPTFYFSNISANTDGNGNYIGGAGTCNTLINPNCRNPNTNFTFQFADTVATSGAPLAYVVYCTTTPTTPTAAATTPINACSGTVLGSAVSYAANTTTNSPAISWTSICNAASANGLGLDSNCNQTSGLSPVTVALYLFLDANGNGYLDPGESMLQFNVVFQSTIPVAASQSSLIGFYQWQSFPGDGECVLVNYLEDTSFSSVGENLGTGAQYLRFYYVAAGTAGNVYDPTIAAGAEATYFANISPSTNANTLKATDISIDSSGNLQPGPYITGLSNGTNYYFKAAIVDNAGNIGYVTPSTDDIPTSPALQGAGIIQLAHACQPGQVAGLLSKNGNCFIATVAYGSPMAEEIKIFRAFRDQILMKTKFGQRFVRWYYHYGSAFAERIRHHDDIRALVRGGLYPLLCFSWLALKIGAYNACLLLGTLFLLPFLIFRFVTTRKKEDLLT